MSRAENKVTNGPGALAKKTPGRVLFFQPKLTVNASDDQYKQGPDRMADRIVDGQVTGQAFLKPSPIVTLPIQRKCSECEKEEKIHRKETSSKAAEANGEASSYISSLSSKGSPMSNRTKNFFESKFGQD